MYFRTLIAAGFLAAALFLAGCTTSSYYHSDYDYGRSYRTDYDYSYRSGYYYPYGNGYHDRSGYYRYGHVVDDDDSW